MRINDTPNQLGPIQPEDIPAGQDVVYLLHFEPTYQHAGHYCGRTNHLRRRLRQHTTGYGNGLVWAATLHDCDVKVARVFFPDDAAAFERRLRRQKNHPRYCPICNPTLKGASNAT